MDLKKLYKALLFPHIAVMIFLLPISVSLLVWAMVSVGQESITAYISYVLAAYTLTVWCFRIPRIISFFKSFKNENRYARIWQSDVRLRVNVSLGSSLLWNVIYGVFQLCLGLYHRTFWFCSLGGYYICLGAMRLFLIGHTTKYAPGEKMETEYKKYRACGWVFLLLNLALTLIIFFMIYWGRTFRHHMITAIAMAAYTFTAFTIAIINVVKYRKYKSPVFSASKYISFASALVSMLTLESTMLTTFGDGTMSALHTKIMLGSTGGVISALIVTSAVYMITVSTRILKKIKLGDKK